MRYLLSLIAISFLFISYKAEAQSEQVRHLMGVVASGNVHDAKAQIPDLLAAYPGDPGVQLLHGVVIDDAFRAFEIYKRIVSQYPDSEWADDAYWRIVQFHAILGDTTKAKYELGNFRKRFPKSEYLLPATDIVRSAIGLAKKSNKKQEVVYKPSSTSYQTQTKKIEDKPQVKIIEPVEKKQAVAEPVQEKTPAVAQVSHSEEKENEPIEQYDMPSKGKYGLQVGIYSTTGAANAEMRKFMSQGLITKVIEKDVDGDNMYAVVIGDYSSLESAEAAKSIVANQCKCNPIIYKK